MAELKPCPFCRHEAIVDDCGDHGYFVRCSNCCINQGKLYALKCDAIEAWNRRAEDLNQLEAEAKYSTSTWAL